MDESKSNILSVSITSSSSLLVISNHLQKQLFSLPHHVQQVSGKTALGFQTPGNTSAFEKVFGSLESRAVVETQYWNGAPLRHCWVTTGLVSPKVGNKPSISGNKLTLIRKAWCGVHNQISQTHRSCSCIHKCIPCFPWIWLSVGMTPMFDHFWTNKIEVTSLSAGNMTSSCETTLIFANLDG